MNGKLQYESKNLRSSLSRSKDSERSFSASFLNVIDDSLRGLFAGADTIGDADAVVGVAGKSEAGKRADGRFDISNSLLMADVILRHGVRMAPETREKRLSSHAKQAG